MAKPYSLGLIVGRFQTVHLGHADMIGKALELCETVAVFVGSSQESGTEANPFSYEVRRSMLNALYGSQIAVYPLPDLGVGNNCLWGDYVLNRVRERFNRIPDLFISGKESRRSSWFSGEAGRSISELFIPKTVDISASRMRTFLLKDERDNWQRFTDPRLWPMYDELRKNVMEAEGKKRTESI